VAPASLSTVGSSARGRDANTAYLYERIAEGDHEHAEQPDNLHVMRRGTSHDAAQLVRGIIATATTGHAPPTRSPQAPTARISPTGYAASPTAAPTPFNPGGRPTGTGTRKLAQMPLLDLLAEDLQAAVADPDSDSWAELNTLSRVEAL
jgi:hypothetical protein